MMPTASGAVVEPGRAGSPRLALLAFAWLALFLAQPPLTLGWGPTAHELVNTWAIQVLPQEIRPFFENNRTFLVEHANDPDNLMKTDRYERMRHYIYLDKYGVFPYVALPHSYNLAKEKFAWRVSRDGMLPWQIGEFSLRLTKSLRGGSGMKLNWTQPCWRTTWQTPTTPCTRHRITTGR